MGGWSLSRDKWCSGVRWRAAMQHPRGPAAAAAAQCTPAPPQHRCEASHLHQATAEPQPGPGMQNRGKHSGLTAPLCRRAAACDSSSSASGGVCTSDCSTLFMKHVLPRFCRPVPCGEEWGREHGCARRVATQRRTAGGLGLCGSGDGCPAALQIAVCSRHSPWHGASGPAAQIGGRGAARRRSPPCASPATAGSGPRC